ncbi:MAG: 1-(5-phosphoribosyl)-5-[(5-phosphoribosylamino)methylideneamino] imidazole-4-carboxamide isomerase [Gemmatimonadota bacterium]
MIVFAAIDLQQGEVVQLEGGRAEATRVRWNDPVAVAEKWVAAGFRALHVIDLDAARGTGSNLHLVEAIIACSAVPVQVGGGMRDEIAIERMLEIGAARVIVGTRAIEDPDWRRRAAARFPGKLVLAADVRGQRIVTRGWTSETSLHWRDVIHDIADDPLAAVLVTDVSREGLLAGSDIELFQAICETASLPVYAAGGIAGDDDVIRLREIGAAGAVLGMALYTGQINLATNGAEE